MRALDRLTRTLKTSREIILAIIEITGDAELDIITEWQNPSNRNAIIQRAKELRSDPAKELYWGAEGRVA